MQDTIRNPKLWVPTLYLAQGLPYFAVAIVASQMLKSMGVPNDELNHWIALVGLPWALKPLWSPFLELAPSKKLVVTFLQVFGGLCLGGVALALQAPFWFAASLAMLALVGIASATHDISCDGLYITSLDEKGQAQYAGWTGTFFNAAKFFTTGGLLLLAGHFEKTLGVVPAWTICFCILGAMMIALGLYNRWALPLAQNQASKDTNATAIARTLWEVIVAFFQKPGIWVSIIFIILFRAGEAQVQSIGPLFLREARALGGLGLSTAEVGAVYGTVGTVAFLVGSIAGGYFTSWLSLKRAILWLILAVNLPNVAFYLLSTFQPTDLSIISAALSVEMFGYGFGFVGLILYMMQVVAPGKFQTAHYAFATGIMQLGSVLFKLFSGDIQIALGYQHFFIWVMLSAIPVAILSQVIPMVARPQQKEEAQAAAVQHA
ncbi:MFS transporter, PAT family, beta-lactamase induction signal transducer AmpG [Duganella sp. CF402]|uniref:MFS transporter n=1 Tax=unclassified Duganella TaxID=2636909 RepID=UPI0008B51DAB|nr:MULTISPECIES: MFS transporter [unclassified Duganella]RZT04397.1 PAT family beta-lactamase induction signal transducer AmpG [Duganella sp. BK701]SEM37901.1 MFS transporter, PAT family, beta-lactamase induction signal transducer AmpG [Duganella sp. CF402]